MADFCSYMFDPFISGLNSKHIFDGIEPRAFPFKISSTVTGSSCKAFPVLGVMGNFQTFAHASEVYGMAAWNIAGTKGMVADGSRFTR